MIGVFDYTVILTYMSLLSGVLGIIISLHGHGHPFLGVYFLLFCGLCDTFDGRVARSKKNRTEREKAFGVQIDSFSDLVAFGVLPGCIGIALVHVNDKYTDVPLFRFISGDVRYYPILIFAGVMFYVLAAMIRLAHFNVLEAERQQTTDETLKYYTGLPVTSAALIFPAILLLHYITAFDLTIIYFFVLVITGFLFLGKFHIKKPNMNGIMLMLLLGIIEFILFIVFKKDVPRPEHVQSIHIQLAYCLHSMLSL